MTAISTEVGAIDLRHVRRVLRSPKGNLLLVLGTIAVLALAVQDSSRAAPAVVNAVAVAMLTDIAVQRVERGLWVFPTAGILSGLIVGLILSPYEPAVVAPAAAVLAITTKHLFRVRLANVFNPAGLALVVAAVLFGSGHSWWGALPDLGWMGAAIIGAAGWYTANRINKLPMVLVFLGAFYALATTASFAGDPGDISSVFRAPDLHAALFFAFFMLDDPPTSPAKLRDQAVFGLLVAATAFAALEVFGWLYYLLAGLLVGNGWWALQRTYRERRRRARRRVVGPAGQQEPEPA